MTEEEKQAMIEHDEQMRGYLKHGAQAGAVAGVAATAALFGIQRYCTILVFFTLKFS